MYLNVVVKLKMLSHGHYKVVKPGRKYYVCNTTEENFEELKVGINIAALESLSVNWSQN